MRSHDRALSPSVSQDVDDVMLAVEVARFLRMNVKSVYEQAKSGNLPCWKLGRHFRFSRRALVAHLAQCKSLPHREGE
jgi:excisionase family DNA binding protein